MPTDPLNIVGITIAEKYRLDACVGVGGFAAVYRAMHLTWQRAVAVKVFRESERFDWTGGARDELVKNLIQEASVLAELSERDATICQARDVGTLTTADGRFLPYLVLEWLEGTPLDRVLRNERAQGLPPRSVPEAIALLAPVARALSLAHRRGVAHRDIKPANIFVMGDARGEHTMKLLDFGIAKVVDDLQNSREAFSETQGPGSAFTPTYAAPEQFSRKFGATGPWTDVYALALLFTELVSNRAPLEGENLTELAFASIDPNKRPTPRARGVVVPDAVENVMKKALAIDHTQRFPSTQEFWQALVPAAGTSSFTSAQTARFLPSAPQSQPVAAPSFGPQLVTAPAFGAGSGGTGGSGGSLPPSGPQIGMSTEEPHQLGPLSRSRGPNPAVLLAIAATVALLLGVGGVLGAMRLRRGATPPGSAIASSSALPSPSVVASASASALPLAAAACPDRMVPVPAGKFFMGSDEKADFSFEKPAHQVTLGAYCIDRFEVTAGEYKLCSDKGDCKRAQDNNDWDGISDKEKKIFDPLCNAEDPAKKDHPMNCIDWRMARAFCKAQKKRLPTEAEWEHAARGSDGRRYPWGDDLPTSKHLNACGTECVAWGKKNGIDERAMYQADDGFETTSPVGSFPAGKTVFGAEDMVGNVWEWVYDNYAPYTDGAQNDPRGPARGEDRVIRGGAWNGTDPGWVRPTFRYHDVPTKRSYGIGFRCAKSNDNDG